jgi:hypothetical protein
LVEFDLDLLEITQIDRNLNFKLDRWFLRRHRILQEIQGSVGFWCGKTSQFEPETARKFFLDSKIWNRQAKFPFFFQEWIDRYID